MKRFVSESRPFQIRSTVEIPGRASLREERTAELFQIEIGILIDSDAELFMHLIQCMRFGSGFGS